MTFFLSNFSVINPWTVDAVNAFSFFCCPECDYKSKAVPHFISHAAKNHPNAKEFCDSHDLLKHEVKYEDLDIKENLVFSDQQNEDFVSVNPNLDENQEETDFFDQIISYQDFEVGISYQCGFH